MGYFFAIVLPPMAILFCGKPIQAVCNIFLTLCGWIPGVVHALFVVHGHKADERAKRLERAYYASAHVHMQQYQ